MAGLAATIAIGLAYLLQSPRFLSRYGQGELGSNRQARVATGIGFALLVLAFGFFLAGVPLESDTAPVSIELSPPVGTPFAQETPPALGDEPASTSEVSAGLGTDESGSSGRTTTGAVAGPPVASSTIAATVAISSSEVPTDETPETPAVTPEATVTSTLTPRPTSSPTTTATSTPTVTPSPTVTPTPIDAETALINTQGSTLWVRRTPGGQPLALVQDGDVVILSTGHAHQGGLLWREVITVAGETGWVQEEFLSYSDQI